MSHVSRPANVQPDTRGHRKERYESRSACPHQVLGTFDAAGLSRVLRESYNTAGAVYRLAKARGMDLVAITDHDAIGGALVLGDRDDVIVGCEVTAEFPDEPFRVHLNVLDITQTQHDEIQRRRRDVRDLLPYLLRAGDIHLPEPRRLRVERTPSRART